MKRALRIGALILILFIRNVSSPPPIRKRELLVMERFACYIYNITTNSYAKTLPSRLRLSDMMKPSLLAQTYAIVDLVRGWAQNETQEDEYRDAALNYLHVATMHRFLTCVVETMEAYIQLHSFSKFKYLDKLRAHLANWRWPVIFDPFLSFELIRFHTFSITVSPLNGTIPFVMSLTNPNSIRFMENFPTNSTQTVVRSWLYSRPIPHAPQLNYNNEAEILFHAQRLVLKWCDYLKNETYTSREFLVRFGDLMNEATSTQLEKSIRQSMRLYHVDFARVIPDLVVLQLVAIGLRFLAAEYQRHQCHPAKALYASDYDTSLQANNAKLQLANAWLTQRANAKIECAIITTSMLNVLFRDYFMLHVGYALDNVPDNILRFLRQCESIELVQNHYDYE